MRTIIDFLKRTRIVEPVDPATDAMYKDFQGALAKVMPEVSLTPIRSISADVFCVQFRGVHHIVWDETYVDSVLPIAFSLLDSSSQQRKSAAIGFALQIMADLLFDEALYMDAWIVGATGFGQTKDSPMATEQEQVYPIEIQNSMLAFLFLHEMGHLLSVYDPPTYKSLRADVEKRIRRYSQYLAYLQPHERRASLDGQGLLLTVGEVPHVDDTSELNKNLIEEAVSDAYATMHVFDWLVHSASSAVAVSEAILAMRMAMEVVREIRESTRFVAVEKRNAPVQSEPEQMRSLLLRHTLFWYATDFASSRNERGDIGAEFVTRHNRLLDKRASVYGGMAKRLVDYGMDEARKFRRRMHAWQQFIEVNDLDSRYMKSYLRLRKWALPEGHFDELGLDQLPDFIATIVNVFIKELQERFHVSSIGDGTGIPQENWAQG